jgi:hypothetical protein
MLKELRLDEGSNSCAQCQCATCKQKDCAVQCEAFLSCDSPVTKCDQAK